MALTLAEAAKLSNDVLVQGVIATIVKNNPILELLPFIEIEGNALRYVREATLATAEVYAVGDTWAESTPTTTEHTASLKIIGGDADVDQFLQQTRSNVNDLEATMIELKAKAIRHKFEDLMFYGDSSVNTKEFDGLHTSALIPTSQQLHMGSGTTGNALSLIKLDEAIDMVKGEPPDLIVMTRAIRRRITQHTRASGFHFTVERDEMGRQLELYGNVRLVISDFLTQTEALSSGVYSAKTGGATSTVFVLRFGEGTGVCGATHGGIQVERLGTLETKDARRTRVKFYASLLNFGTVSASLVDGCTDAAVSDS